MQQQQPNRYRDNEDIDVNNNERDSRKHKKKYHKPFVGVCSMIHVSKYLVFVMHFIMNLSFAIALYGRFYQDNILMYLLTHLLYYFVTFFILFFFIDTNGDYWVLSTSSLIIFTIGFYIAITDMIIERKVGFASLSYGFYYLSVETKNLIKEIQKNKIPQ